MVKLVIVIEDKLHTDFKTYCAKTGVTMAQIVRNCIKEYVDKSKTKIIQ